VKTGGLELKKNNIVVGVLVFLVAVIASCGGSSDGNDQATSASGSSAEPTPVKAATAVPTATSEPATSSNADTVALGKKEFGTCAGCHGADATGVTGLGKNLVGSDFITDISDDDLATFIKVGRSSSDPANTTGIDMPPKGGNPALNDEKLDAIVAYIRSLQ
jgi:mono/diheme cytochrome c family protein